MTKTEIKAVKEAITTIRGLVDQIYPEGFDPLKESLTRGLNEILKGEKA